MNFLIDLIWGMAGDDAALALFFCLAVLCVGIVCIGAVCNALGKSGRVTLLVALAVVTAVWLLTRT